MEETRDDIIDQLISEWKSEKPELDSSAMHIVGRILILGKLLEKRAGKVLKGSNIHYTDLDVLATLRRSGKPFELTPKELMTSVLITSGSMTALLDRLTKLDLIYRVTDSKDKRIRRAGLTQKGVETIETAIKVRFEEASNSVATLDKTEREQFSTLLKKLLLSLD